MSTIGHVFYEVHLGLGHTGLQEVLRTKVKGGLKQGEFALFLNRSMSACKILSPDSQVILYYRGPGAVTAHLVKNLPGWLGGKAFGFGGNLESRLLKILNGLPERKASEVKLLA